MELRTSCLDNEEFFKYQKSINILMHTILSPVTLCHKLITEEWKQLFTLMDIFQIIPDLLYSERGTICIDSVRSVYNKLLELTKNSIMG